MALPPLRIADAPRFVWRGLMLDSARHFQTVAFLKKRIDVLASLKVGYCYRYGYAVAYHKSSVCGVCVYTQVLCALTPTPLYYV